MPTIGETARIRTNEPDDNADELVKNAWLLWSSARNKCVRHRVPLIDGGYEFRGALRGLVRSLWPYLEGPEQKTFERSVYTFLRQTGNAKCTQKQDPPIWFISDQFSTILGRSHTYVPTAQTRAEAKVTPQEAGEDLSPGEVTIRYTKERQDPMATATKEEKRNPAESLFVSQEARRRERDERRELIAEFIQKEAPEPAVVDEVAHYFGLNETTVRKDLTELVLSGVLFSRQETGDERAIRYGQTAFARRSVLYWGTNPVPARTMRSVIEGYEVSAAERSAPMSSDEINRRLWAKLKRKGPRTKFTALALADSAHIHQEMARSRIRELRDAGYIAKCGAKDGSAEYRVLNSDGVREYLGQPPEDVLDLPREVVAVKTPPTPEPPAPIPSATPADVEMQIRAVLAENSRLRARVTELEAQIATPSIDPELQQQLAAWSPSTS